MLLCGIFVSSEGESEVWYYSYEFLNFLVFFLPLVRVRMKFETIAVSFLTLVKAKKKFGTKVVLLCGIFCLH